MKQYKRPSVNIPKELLAALNKRIVEVGYPSHSAYFLGLMLFDLWAGKGHAVAVNARGNTAPGGGNDIGGIPDVSRCGKEGLSFQQNLSRLLR